MPKNQTIDSPVEYALYALAVKQPELFAEAERFVGGMLAENQDAARRVKEMLGQGRSQMPSADLGQLETSGPLTRWQRIANRERRYGHVPRGERSCAFCVLARWWSGLTRCDHCGWVWDGKTPRKPEMPGKKRRF